MSDQQSDQKHRLYTLPETREKMGPLAERLTELAGMPVLLVEGSALPISEKEQALRDKADSAAFLPEVKLSLKEEAALARIDIRDKAYLRQKLIDTGQDPKSEMSGIEDYYMPMAQIARSNLGAAHILPGGAGGKLCVITVQNLSSDPGKIVSDLSGIPAEKFVPLHGSVADWNGMVLAHEAGHCGDISLASHSTLQREIFADRIALRDHFQHAAADTTHTHLELDLMHARALGALNGDYDHASGPWIESPDMDAGSISVKENVMRIHGKVYDRIAEETGISKREAARFSNEDPALFYNTLKKLDYDGEFAEDPTDQIMVWQYLEAGAAIAPAHFGIDGNNDPLPKAPEPAPENPAPTKKAGASFFSPQR